jgi:hypothetical protein
VNCCFGNGELDQAWIDSQIESEQTGVKAEDIYELKKIKIEQNHARILDKYNNVVDKFNFLKIFEPPTDEPTLEEVQEDELKEAETVFEEKKIKAVNRRNVLLVAGAVVVLYMIFS